MRERRKREEEEARRRELEQYRQRMRATDGERVAMAKVLGSAELPDVVRRSLVSAEALTVSERKLGGGAFGEVWLASYHGTPVAAKYLSRARLTEEHLRAFRAEFELQLSLRHPNIVQLYEIIETPRQLYLITEYVPGGELFDYIVKTQRLREDEACKIFQ